MPAKFRMTAKGKSQDYINWMNRLGVDEDEIDDLIDEFDGDIGEVLGELQEEIKNAMQPFLNNNPSYPFDKIFNQNLKPILTRTVQSRLITMPIKPSQVPDIIKEYKKDYTIKTERDIQKIVPRTLITDKQNIYYRKKVIGHFGKFSSSKGVITRYKNMGIGKLKEKQVIRLVAHMDRLRYETGAIKNKKEVKKYLTVTQKQYQRIEDRINKKQLFDKR